MPVTFKSDTRYFTERLKEPELLKHAVKVRIKGDRFLCVPCGGSRVTGFTHFFPNNEDAMTVCYTLLRSGENFPDLRVEPIVNYYGDLMWMVKWGVEEPLHLTGWDFEVAVAKQLGYSDECMPAHRERMEKAKEVLGFSLI